MVSGNVKVAGSQIFQPFRALGHVTNHIPFALQSRGNNHFVTTCLGNAFHIYNCSRLNLLFVGPALNQDIQCLTAQGDLTFTACGKEVISWKRGKQVQVYAGYSSNVHLLLCFGEHLLAVTEDNKLVIRKISDGEIHVELDFDPSSFHITGIMHPSTYLNKVLLTSRQGTMQLWNIRTGKLVYEFKSFGSGITAVVQAPAVDVVGVGLEDGRVVVHNLKYDERILSFTQEWGPVIGLSFRTDEHPVLATTAGGRVMLWDLEKRKLITTMIDPHNGQVTSLQFLQSQPLMLTSGNDNAIKLWIFDQPDGNPRLLRSRSGHSAPPTLIRHYGPTGKEIMTAGLDRALRNFSTIQDQQNIEFSQGSVLSKSKKLGIRAEELKLPPVIAFAAEDLRQKDWDNVITAHLNTLDVHTWSYENKVIGKHILKPNRPLPNVVAKAVALSPCGNFAVVGLSNGEIDRYNIQSGLHRGSYGKPSAHKGMIRSIVTDALNQVMVSGGADGMVKFWDFTKHRRIAIINTGAPVSKMVLHRESNLLAVGGDDFIVRVYDVDTKKLVREFPGHANRITDMTFSNDCRWLITSSMDATVRVWDLVSARPLDWFRVEAPVTGLSMSPTLDFLATTHVDSVGVCLWANKTIFSNVTIKPINSDYEPTLVEMPSAAAMEEDIQQDGQDSAPGEEADLEDDNEYKSPDQLSEELLTLSSVPASHWQTLANLDLIKERNKPTEAPKAPEAAPFFLPTASGLVPKFVAGDDDAPAVTEGGSRLINLGKLNPMSPFQSTLLKCAAADNYDDLISMMSAMGPASIDLEFRSLSPMNNCEQHRALMTFMCHELDMRRNFELIESYMSLYLR
eukprot:Ihof_evm5s26 gene=Ihof_evmTU5s26